MCSVCSRPLDTRMLALLMAIRNNTADPRVKMVLNKLQGSSSPQGRRGSSEGSMSPNQPSHMGMLYGGGGVL